MSKSVVLCCTQKADPQISAFVDRSDHLVLVLNLTITLMKGDSYEFPVLGHWSSTSVS